jgi:hypothetical protein
VEQKEKPAGRRLLFEGYRGTGFADPLEARFGVG